MHSNLKILHGFLTDMLLCSCVENKWVKLMSLEEIKMIRGIKHYNIGNYNFIYIHETGSIFLKVGGGDVKLHFEHKIKVMCTVLIGHHWSFKVT